MLPESVIRAHFEELASLDHSSENPNPSTIDVNDTKAVEVSYTPCSKSCRCHRCCIDTRCFQDTQETESSVSLVDRRILGLPFTALVEMADQDAADEDGYQIIDYQEFKSYVVTYSKAQSAASRLMPPRTPGYCINRIRHLMEKNEVLQVCNCKACCDANSVTLDLSIPSRHVRKSWKELNIRYDHNTFETAFQNADVYRDCRHQNYRYYDPTDPDGILNFGELCDFLVLYTVAFRKQ